MPGPVATTHVLLGVPVLVLVFTALGFDDPPPPKAVPIDEPIQSVPKVLGLEQQIDRLAESLKKELEPRPLVPIPDDPSPHEGALFQIPYIIEPPDILI